MPTKSFKPVTRESTALVRERGLRAVMVTIVGGIIELRAKGLRARETVDVAWCYYTAVKQRIARQRADKAKGRSRK